MYGVESKEDGVVLLKIPGGENKKPTNSPRKAKGNQLTLRTSTEAKARNAHENATKYMVSEVCMDVSNYSGELVDSDFLNEELKAIKKLKQVNDSVGYLKSRYTDQKARSQETRLPHESKVVGAAFLGCIAIAMAAQVASPAVPRKPRDSRKHWRMNSDACGRSTSEEAVTHVT